MTSEKVYSKAINRVSESRLEIFEVPLNASTKFKCTEMTGEYSKEISFRVKGEFKTDKVVIIFPISITILRCRNEQRISCCPIRKRKT